MPLCRWSWLYHAANWPTHARASATVANPVLGYSGQYLSVRNSASEYGLCSVPHNPYYAARLVMWRRPGASKAQRGICGVGAT
jgi:hypothetical protein